jgi:hypothetical protein
LLSNEERDAASQHFKKNKVLGLDSGWWEGDTGRVLGKNLKKGCCKKTKTAD